MKINHPLVVPLVDRSTAASSRGVVVAVVVADRIERRDGNRHFHTLRSRTSFYDTDTHVPCASR